MKKTQNFNELCEEIYFKLQDVLLLEFETRRFEKSWLSNAAKMFYNSVDKDVCYMMAIPNNNPQIFIEVLERFDPRPEVGFVFIYIYISFICQYSFF